MRAKKGKSRKKTGARNAGRKETRNRRSNSFSFGFFLVVCLILAGTGVFILVQHQYAVTNELKVDRIDQNILSNKARQKSLRIKLAKLKSPGRVARIAEEELGMVEPGGVIYLKYRRDQNGKLVCMSTYEKRSEAPPVTEADKEEASVETEEPVEALTKR